ncbi:MAG: hypothetical protein KBH78_09780 [Candidatus Hydrogenedentes bacterium]|nr:hypothetical protein [Candidatus Hydrogenedentota bacterium]HOJ67566.1 hypothetical protein [Candidatus Hydrogenedentota bacterium]
MKRASVRYGVFFATVAPAILLLLAGETARAWNQRAMQSIAGMGLQMLKNDYPNTFRPGGVAGPNFERDVLQGAAAGWKILQESYPLSNDNEVIQAIAAEIMLLREARNYGPTSYYAYRLGVLAALVADAVVPLGFPWTPDDRQIADQMFRDIDANLDGFKFAVTQSRREFISDAFDYFGKRRQFNAEDSRLIRNDYRSGVGYNGFLKQAAPTYFSRAVEAVADTWDTVLRNETRALGLSKPSNQLLTWYFVNEIAYLLNTKQHFAQALDVYKNLEKVNPQMADAYDKVGDLFYNFGSRESKLRGLAEWEKAYSVAGADRTRIGKKIAEHYINEGNFYLDKAAKPGAEDTDLQNALNAFERAIDYDRTNDLIARKIQETNVAIQERNERLEMTINIIATGEKVRAEADGYRDRKDYANAIRTYRQAIGFFEAVDDEFKEQANTAKESIRRLQKSIQDVINEVLDMASQAIDEGDRAKDANRFDEAINAYNRVSTIVGVIPEDEVSQSVKDDKNKLIDLSKRKVEEANVAKVRYEQAMAEQQAAGARPGGAAPGTPAAPAAAPAAPAATPAAPAAPAPVPGLEPSVPKNLPPPPNIPGLSR